MKGIVKSALVIMAYFALAIFLGRAAHYGASWPRWACELIALPILILGCIMAYALRGDEGEKQS